MSNTETSGSVFVEQDGLLRRRFKPLPPTEQDPTGRKAGAPGAKLDAGKPMAGLLLEFSLALMAVAEVATYGAQKYSLGGWRQVPDGQRRYTDAMMRHLLAGGGVDPDSGIAHDAHSAWNALARLEMRLMVGGE